MNNFDIKTYLDNQRNIILLSHYWSSKKSPFYILRYTEPHFIVTEDHQNEWLGKFVAIPRDIHTNSTSEINYLFGVTNRAMAVIEENGVDFSDYIKIFGEYHFKKYLDTLELPLSEDNLSPKVVVNHREIEKENYKPNIINNSIESPETRIEINERQRLLRLRFLVALWDFKHRMNMPGVGSQNSALLEKIFCDSKEIRIPAERLISEGMIEWNRFGDPEFLTITAKGEKFVGQDISHPQEDNNSSEDRKLAAIMFMDIVGYTSMMENDETKTFGLIEQFRKEVKTMIQIYNGKITQFTGDGILCYFGSCVLATKFALEMQTNHKSNEFQVRIGIHLGDILLKDDDIIGNAVNVASRIEPLAKPGGICISSKVNDELKNHPNIETNSLGLKKLKNVKDSVEVYELVINEFTVSFEEIGGIEGIVDSYQFENKGRLAELLELLSNQQFPNETFDGMFEELAEKGFSDEHYESMFEIGLVEYKSNFMNHNFPHEQPDWDNFGWLELTELGKLVLRETKELN